LRDKWGKSRWMVLGECTGYIVGRNILDQSAWGDMWSETMTFLHFWFILMFSFVLFGVLVIFNYSILTIIERIIEREEIDDPYGIYRT